MKDDFNINIPCECGYLFRYKLKPKSKKMISCHPCPKCDKYINVEIKFKSGDKP